MFWKIPTSTHWPSCRCHFNSIIHGSSDSWSHWVKYNWANFIKFDFISIWLWILIIFIIKTLSFINEWIMMNTFQQIIRLNLVLIKWQWKCYYFATRHHAFTVYFVKFELKINFKIGNHLRWVGFFVINFFNIYYYDKLIFIINW